MTFVALGVVTTLVPVGLVSVATVVEGGGSTAAVPLVVADADAAGAGVVTALPDVAAMVVATVVVTGSVTVVVGPGVSAANSRAAATPRISAPASPSSQRCVAGSAGRAIATDWLDVGLGGKVGMG